MMKKLKIGVENLVAKELELANENFPQFNGPHEGYAVMLEEYEELQDAYHALMIGNNMGELWKSIKKDFYLYDGNVRYIKNYAINIACEAIQLAAMSDKFIAMMETEKIKSKEEEDYESGLDVDYE